MAQISYITVGVYLRRITVNTKLLMMIGFLFPMDLPARGMIDH